MRQDDILKVIRERGPLTVVEIPDTLGVDLSDKQVKRDRYSEAHRCIRALEKYDLVQKVASGMKEYNVPRWKWGVVE